MNLTIAPDILEELNAHAKAMYPNEACGLLVGRHMAERFIAMQNSASDPSRNYEIAPQELISILRDLRDTGERLIAIFHSHPHGPAGPSQTDIDRAYYPDAALIIVSLADLERPQFAAFRIVDGQPVSIEVHAIV